MTKIQKSDLLKAFERDFNKGKKQWEKCQAFSRKSEKEKLEMGEFLVNLKPKVGHGNWALACKEIGINQETARRLMHFYKYHKHGVAEPTNKELSLKEGNIAPAKLSSVVEEQNPQLVGSDSPKLPKPTSHWCPDGKCCFEEETILGFQTSICKKCWNINPDNRFKDNSLSEQAIQERYRECSNCHHIAYVTTFIKRSASDIIKRGSKTS